MQVTGAPGHDDRGHSDSAEALDAFFRAGVVSGGLIMVTGARIVSRRHWAPSHRCSSDMTDECLNRLS